MRYRKSWVADPTLEASGDASQFVGTSWAASWRPTSTDFVSTGSSPTAAFAINGSETAAGAETGAAPATGPADGSCTAAASAGAGASEFGATVSGAARAGEGCQNDMRSSGKPGIGECPGT